MEHKPTLLDSWEMEKKQQKKKQKQTRKTTKYYPKEIKSLH